MGEWELVEDVAVDAAAPTETWTLVDETATSVDKGPEARRAASGLPPGPRDTTPEEIGDVVGPTSQVYVNPVVNKLFPTDLGHQTPSTPEQQAAIESTRKSAEGLQGIQDVQRAIGATAIAGPVAAGGKALGAAAGLGPKLANILGGSAAGAVTSVVATGDVANAPVGAAAGGALAGASDLMKFVVGRVAAPAIAKGFARAKGGEEGAEMLKDVDIAKVIKKYDIAGVSTPRVAKEAIDASVVRAETARRTAQEALSKVGGKGAVIGKDVGRWAPSEADVKFAEKLHMPLDKYRAQMSKLTAEQRGTVASPELVKQAEAAVAQAEAEIAVLKKLQPVANRLAAAAQLKPTVTERLGQNASRVAKVALPAAVGAGLYKAFTGEGTP